MADSCWAHFQPVFETSSDCLLLIEAESARVVAANPALERQLGLAAGEWNSKSFYAVPALKALAADHAAFKTFAAEISARPREMDLRNARGENIHVNARAATYSAQDKSFLLLRFKPLAVDTRSNENLMKSTWLARLVFENAPDGINVRQVGSDFKSMKLLACNQRFIEMSGFREAKLRAIDDISRCQKSLLTAQEDEVNERKLRALLPISGISTWLRPDGKENCFEWRGVPMRVGEAVYVLGIDRDITVQRRALNELRERTAELDALINNIPDLVWFKDTQSRYITVNAAFLKAIGKTLDELRGKTDFAVSPSDLARKYQSDDARVVRDKRMLTFEEKHELKGHPTRWIVTTKSPILDDAGQVLGTVGIARDITDRREAELENEKQRRKLETLLKKIRTKVHEERKPRRVVRKVEKMLAAKTPAQRKKKRSKKHTDSAR